MLKIPLKMHILAGYVHFLNISGEYVEIFRKNQHIHTSEHTQSTYSYIFNRQALFNTFSRFLQSKVLKNSPEGKFPIPLEQSYEALLWATSHTELLQIDDRVAVVGDSAGGNMAAALCLMARDRQGPKIDFQVLINPAPDLSCNGTLEKQEDKLDVLRWQAKMYTKTSEEVYLPYVSPSLAEDLTGLPPALVVVAELDDLRHDGESYACKLRVAGVPTNLYCQWGINHLAGHAARASEIAIESLDIAATSLLGVFKRIKRTQSKQ